MAEEEKQIRLLGYVTLTGVIKCITGIHIGGTADSIDKGGIDSPVINNPVTNEPYIPGSSLRGRLRSILEKAYGLQLDKLVSDIYLHHWEEEDNPDSVMVCRVFGGFPSDRENGKKIKVDGTIPSVLIVRDCLLEDKSHEYMHGKLPITEAKMETAIDRVTSAAHPRTIERVPAGAKFSLELIYKVQSDQTGEFTADDDENVRADLENLLWALEIIEKKDGLGGHSARGYGQVKFKITDIQKSKLDLKSKSLLPTNAEKDKRDYNFWRQEIAKISFLEDKGEKEPDQKDKTGTKNPEKTDSSGD